MANYYTFVCSLNYLDFQGEAPMAPAEFLEQAANWLPAGELAALCDWDLPGGPAIAAEWSLYERSLKSAVAAVRAQRLGREFQPDRLSCDILDGQTRQSISELYKGNDPLKLERGLDGLRFAKLDELGAGHFFDFTAVFCYYAKLCLMWRWQTLDSARGLAVVKDCCTVKQQG